MSEPFLGQIQPFGFNFAPSGWALCQGQLLPIAQYSALFSLLGTTYGGDGQTTFALPDLRGRSMVGFGQGPGLSNIQIGQKSGQESVTLQVVNMPVHNHTATATATLFAEGLVGTSANPTGKMLAGIPNAYITPDPAQNRAMSDDSITASVTVANTGGSQPFNIRNPYLGINISIALQGIFPSRN